MVRMRILFLLFILFTTIVISCGDSGDTKASIKNRTDTTGVDYSIPDHLKPVMNIPHSTYLESYYSVNIPADTVSNAQRDSINPIMIKVCDSLKDIWHEAVIIVLKETAYTNKISKAKGISDGINPFTSNNVYLLKYTFRDTENIYVLKYDPKKELWKE
jgi:hypothetical protein